MADKVKRIKTGYKNIYYNEKTKKYDVKYNYKEYNPTAQKNDYKSKWINNCATIKEAQESLAKLRTGIVKTEDKDITLAGILEIWKEKAVLQQYSEVTIQSTEHQLKAIYKYLPADTKLKDITENVYYNLFSKLRKEYTDETIHTLNSAFRKLIKLAYKRGLIADNFLYKADNVKTKQKEDYRLLTHEEFEKIDNYLGSKRSKHKGYNAYPRLRFFYNVLYYTGIRLSEALALTWQDFQKFDYYPKNAEKPVELLGIGNQTDNEHLIGMRIVITKSTGRDKDESGQAIVKEPKNKKHRSIPIPPDLIRLYAKEYGKKKDRTDTERIFNYSHSYALKRIKETCKLLDIETCNCHTFRHTYISNLIKYNVPISIIEDVSGDTQETIFKRYSHMFEEDERLVLKALEQMQKGK